MNRKKLRLPRPLRAVLIALFWLAVWQAAAWAVKSELLFPAPAAVLARIAALLPLPSFWQATGSTLARVLEGCLIGSLAGGVAAVAAYRFPFLRELLSPAFTVIRATPVASFILVAIVWMGAGRIPTFTAFLMVLPVVWGAVLASLDGMDRKLYEVAVLYSFSPFRMLTRVYLPAALPGFLSGCVTAMGLGWKAGVAAEVLCSVKASIGRHLHEAQIYLETVDLFAWTLVVILLSLILEALLRMAASHIGKGSAASHPRQRKKRRNEGKCTSHG